MNKIILLSILAAVLFLTSCATTDINSKVTNQKSLGKISKIYYGFYFDRGLEESSEKFVKQTQEVYLKNNVKFGYKEYGFFQNPDDFKLNNLISLALDKGFDHLLVLTNVSFDTRTTRNVPSVNPDGSFTGGGYSKTNISGLEGYLYALSDTTEVWRAQIDVEYSNSKTAGNSLANKLIEKLSDDGFYYKRMHIYDRY